MKYALLRFLYKQFAKPVFFAFDPETIHDLMVDVGEFMGNNTLTAGLLESLFAYKSSKLYGEILGVKFPNPVGLAAGYDYDAHLVKSMQHVGFGFNTVGTVTYHPYEGNQKPRLVRLPKSQSLLVNKGFKSVGVHAVAKRLNDPRLVNVVLGVSVGSSNIPQVDTINKAVDDYLASFEVLEKSPHIKYYELNVSCPNTAMADDLTNPEHFETLIIQVAKINLSRPVFIKMPNELSFDLMDKLVAAAMNQNIRGFIFSNLVKDRTNPVLNQEEVAKVSGLKGNFSGKPTEANSNKLLKHYRRKYGSDIALIGCGGVFTPADALAKFEAGADLVQLITGMIYEGPQLVGEICSKL